MPKAHTIECQTSGLTGCTCTEPYTIHYTPVTINWEWVNFHVEIIGEIEPEALKVDGMDDAIVGVVQQFNKHFLCYSMAKILEILMDRDGMTETEALEFYEFNIVGAYMGEYTPVFLQDY